MIPVFNGIAINSENMNRKVIILICSFCFFISCNLQNTKEREAKFNKHLIDCSKSEMANIDTWMCCKVVPLETNANSLIKQIKKVEVFDGRIVVYDGKLDLINIYNESGKYLANINRKGKGPGEYIELNNFAINKVDSCLEICNGPKQSIQQYDFNGNYLGSKKLSGYVNDLFAVNDSGDYCFYFENQLHHIDSTDLLYYGNDNLESSVLLKSRPIDFSRFTTQENPITSNRDDFYLVRQYDPLIYKVRNGEIEPNYKLEFGENSYSYRNIEMFDQYDIIKRLEFFENLGLPMNIDKLYVSDSHIHVRLCSMGWTDLYIEKGSNNVLVASHYIREKKCRLFTMDVVGAYEDMFIALNTPEDIKKSVALFKKKKLMEDKWYDKFKNLSDTLDLNDNPILVFFKPVF